MCRARSYLVEGYWPDVNGGRVTATALRRAMSELAGVAFERILESLGIDGPQP